MSDLAEPPMEKRFVIIPLGDTGTSVATARNFFGSLYVKLESGQRFVVQVEDGRAIITQTLGEQD